MLLGFGYLYRFVMFYFFFFFQKAENNRLKKSYLTKICDIIFLFFIKIGSVGPVDQQINLVLPDLHYRHRVKTFFLKKTIDQFCFSSLKNICAP